jgi:hypothetical protein
MWKLHLTRILVGGVLDIQCVIVLLFYSIKICHTVKFLTFYCDRMPPDDGQMLDRNMLWRECSYH